MWGAEFVYRDEQKPNNDLPNQEKNQYWTVYWLETWALNTQGVQIKEIDWSSGREATEIGSDAKNRWEWKPIRAACLKWTFLGGNENLFMVAC